jgi:hypothetical protein
MKPTATPHSGFNYVPSTGCTKLDGDMMGHIAEHHRVTRCGRCYWALYDGHMCQNRDCDDYGKDAMPVNVIRLTNKEAMVLIAAKGSGDL